MSAGHKVFLNTLPKSGSHLVFKALGLLGYRQSGWLHAGLVNGLGRHARMRRLVWPLLPGRRCVVGNEAPVAFPLSRIASRTRSAGPGCYVFAHLGHDPGLLQWILDQGFVAFLMTRDPRAVLNSHVHFVMSQVHHAQHDYFTKLSMEERYWADYEGTPHGRVPLLSLRERYLALNLWRDHEQVLTLRFEDLVGMQGGGSEERQQAALSQICSRVGLDDGLIEEAGSRLFGGTNTFRTGRIDAWREEVPQAVLNVVEREMTEFLVDLE